MPCRAPYPVWKTTRRPLACSIRKAPPAPAPCPNERQEARMSKLALCIGINNYPGTDMDLAGCVNDANDWAAELTSRGFSVNKLLDSQATKAGMVDAFKRIVGQAVSGDVVVITYSGHGTYQYD